MTSGRSASLFLSRRTPATVKDVRTAAVYYFSDAHSQDPSIMVLAIQAIRLFGRNEAFEIGAFLRDLPQTDETIRWILDELKRLGQPKDEDATEYSQALLEALTGPRYADGGSSPWRK